MLRNKLGRPAAASGEAPEEKRAAAARSTQIMEPPAEEAEPVGGSLKPPQDENAFALRRSKQPKPSPLGRRREPRIGRPPRGACPFRGAQRGCATTSLRDVGLVKGASRGARSGRLVTRQGD